MIDRSSLKKLSKSLIGLSAYVITITLASVAIAATKGNIMQVIIDLLGVVQNSGSIQEIVISSAHLVIIILAVIWLIIVSVLSLSIVWNLSIFSKDTTSPSDTQ